MLSQAGNSMFNKSKNTISKKKKISIPVIIVEDHNEALAHIYRAIGSKKIPFKDGLMVHFDSHPDLVVPKHLDPQRIYDKTFVINCTSIENWIIPAVFAGHFDYVVWMKPTWATQIDNGLHKFKLGVEKTSKELKVTCPQSYFVGEGSWCPGSNLEPGAKEVTLQVYTLEAPLQKSSAEETDSTDTPSETAEPPPLPDEMVSKMSSDPFVLDIDLDFYSTRNPFLSLFSPLQFEMLRKLYHYEHPTQLTDQALQEATTKRQNQLSELKSIFRSIREGIAHSTSPLYPAVQPLLATFSDSRPPDPDLLNDAGCTCDDCDLPHHVSTKEEVRHLVEETGKFLMRYPKPAIITIARSSRDDYCPPEDVDFIQECVLEMLGQVYSSIDVHRDYSSEESAQDEGTSEGGRGCDSTLVHIEKSMVETR